MKTFFIVILRLTFNKYVFNSFQFEEAFILIMLMPNFLTALSEAFLSERLI